MGEIGSKTLPKEGENIHSEANNFRYIYFGTNLTPFNHHNKASTTDIGRLISKSKKFFQNLVLMRDGWVSKMGPKWLLDPPPAFFFDFF